MSLMDEVKADQKAGSPCAFCAYVVSRPEDEQREWDSICADLSLTDMSIFRAAKKRGFTFTDSPVRVHRQRKHRQ